MSVVWSDSDGWILCHSKYLTDLYATLSRTPVCIYCGKYDVFHIHSPFLKKGQKNQEADLSGNTEMRENSLEELEVSLGSGSFFRVPVFILRNFSLPFPILSV